jgi:hypothetical protein
MSTFHIFSDFLINNYDTMSTRRMQLTFNETLLLSKNKDFFELKNNETKRLNAFLVVKNVKYIFRLYQDNNNITQKRNIVTKSTKII